MMSRETFWTAGALATRAAAQFILTFAVVTQLDKDSASLWFVFMSFWAVVQLLDMGLSMAVLRGASYLWAGHRELKPEGLDESTPGGEPNLPALRDLLTTINSVYAALGVAVVGVGLVLSATLLAPLLRNINDGQAWVCICITAALQLMFSQRYNYLQGVGRLVHAQQIAIVCAWLGYGLTAFALWWGHSLLWASQVMLCLWVLQLFIFDAALKPLAGGRFCHKMILALWPNSLRSGLSRLSLALIYHLPTLLISRLAGLLLGGQYGFTVQLCLFIQSLGQVPVVAVTPRLHELAAQEKLPEVRHLFFQKLRQTMLLDALLFSGLVFCGPAILVWVEAKTTLLPMSLLVAVAFFFWVEHHRNNFVLLVSVFNRFPFWRYDLASGLAVVLGGFFLLPALGLAGFVVWLWLVQAAWNFWWPVKEGLRQLKSSWREYSASMLSLAKS